MKLNSKIWFGDSEKLAERIKKKFDVDSVWILTHEEAACAVVFKIGNFLHVQLYNEHQTLIARGVQPIN